jgi:hypothetical protein
MSLKFGQLVETTVPGPDPKYQPRSRRVARPAPFPAKAYQIRRAYQIGEAVPSLQLYELSPLLKTFLKPRFHTPNVDHFNARNLQVQHGFSKPLPLYKIQVEGSFGSVAPRAGPVFFGPKMVHRFVSRGPSGTTS